MTIWELKDMAVKRKYLFTQLSALLIALITCLFVVKLTIYLFPQVFSDQRVLNVSFFILVLLIAVGLSMHLWGRILVACGVLNEQEAKGYPFSKPWENSDRHV
jgi:hypothetical protein